ncbi:MAG: DUF423 domain-containing protein [Pirellulales bacterium]|nr:DUF423 domain-containing protein [Pirellulales bacterium]
MSSQSRWWIALGALLGAVGVGLGAYGAHGLGGLLEQKLGYSGDDLRHRLDIFETAVRYLMFHAVALVLLGVALQTRNSCWWKFSGWAFLVGIGLFCGLLMVLTFSAPSWKWLGAIVPMGGVAMIVGWLTFAAGALRANDNMCGR